MLTGLPHMKQQFARTLLEQVASLREPQVRIEPEILQYMGKHFNLWHVSIPLLEDHVQLYDQNERYVHALQELYSGLMETPPLLGTAPFDFFLIFEALVFAGSTLGARTAAAS